MKKNVFFASMLALAISSSFAFTQESSMQIVPIAEVGSCKTYSANYKHIRRLKILSIEPRNQESQIVADTFIAKSNPFLGNLFSEARDSYQICITNKLENYFELKISGTSLYFSPMQEFDSLRLPTFEFEATAKISSDSRSLDFTKYIYDNSNLLDQISGDSQRLQEARKTFLDEKVFNVFYKNITNTTEISDAKDRIPFLYVCVFRECANSKFGTNATAKTQEIDKDKIKFNLIYTGSDLNVAYIETNKMKVFENWKPSKNGGSIIISTDGFIKNSQSDFFVNGYNTYIIPTKSKPVTLKIIQQYIISESTVETK